jgi:hypothetical protein
MEVFFHFMSRFSIQGEMYHHLCEVNPMRPVVVVVVVVVVGRFA